MGKAGRESNIELLRIIAVSGVIILHYNNALIGGGMKYASGINLVILYYLESLCICAVNLFVLITGYFMVKAQKRNLWKPLRLMFQVSVFSLGHYLLNVFLGTEFFSVKRIISSLVPANYFVTLYVALYFISPLLNLAILNSNWDALKKYTMILFCLFSVWPTLVDFAGELLGREWTGLSTVGLYGNQRGYTIVNFSLMYFIGAVIRRREDETENIENRNTTNRKKQNDVLYKCAAMYFFIALVLTVWVLGYNKMGHDVVGSPWAYCNPFVVLLAVLGFTIFKELKVPQNKVINRLAGGAFTVFLVHGFLLDRFDVERNVTGNPALMLVHILVSVMLIYLACWIIYEVYAKITSGILKKISNAFPFLTTDLITVRCWGERGQ